MAVNTWNFERKELYNNAASSLPMVEYPSTVTSILLFACKEPSRQLVWPWLIDDLQAKHKAFRQETKLTETL
jgi:hypothetical protein